MRQSSMQRTRQHSTRQLPVRRQVELRPPTNQAASSLMSLRRVPTADCWSAEAIPSEHRQAA